MIFRYSGLQSSSSCRKNLHLAKSTSFRLQVIGRLDTWNTNWLDIESLRAELKDCNLDITLWELFDSQSRQEDVFRLEGDNGNNVHGAEYVE